MERYLRTDGAKVLGAQVAWEAAYSAVAYFAFSSPPYGEALDSADAFWFFARFLRWSACWWYYKTTYAFWLNYLYYTSYTTREFIRLVVNTFTMTCLHELLGGGITGTSFFPFPYQACCWTTKGIESWKAQDPDGYAAGGAPEPGDFVQPHQRYWGWKRPPTWHLILTMECFCTVNNAACGMEYQNYLSKLNAGLKPKFASMTKNAKTVTSKSFRTSKTVDVSASTTCDYKIFGVGSDLADRLHQAMENYGLFVGVNVEVALIDELMRVVCKHVTRNGKPVTIDDCVAMHLNTGTAGPYIPVLHWDVEYGLFPEADGFNIWMLTSSDNAEGSEGNVYIADTPAVTGKDTLPEWIAFTGDGKCGDLPAVGERSGDGSPKSVMKKRPEVVRRIHDLAFPEAETGSYDTIDELKMKFDYVQAKPGECVVWSKRTLHMSDARPLLEERTVKRKVIQIRVVLKPEGADKSTMVFNPDHPNSYLLSGWMSLLDKRTTGSDGKCRVPTPETYDLLQPFYNPEKARAYNEAKMKKS